MAQCMEMNSEVGEVIPGHYCVLGESHQGGHLAVTQTRKFILWSVDGGRFSRREISREEFDQIVYRDRVVAVRAS
jgi:hypothetical protein